MAPIDPNLPPLVIFGCGYVGTRLAKVALAAGRPVRACARSTARLEPLRELGAEVMSIDATRSKQFGPALHGAMSATVVYAIPPPPGMPAGESVRRATQAALNNGVRSFIYLGSSGLYGNRADPDWVDEETPVAHDDPQMAARLTDEAAVQAAAAAGLRTVVLRLAAIYGPGRGVRTRLLKGDYKMIAGGEHFISRIHVDDLARIILAAEEKAPPGAVYVVGDDRPTPQKEYASWLAERLGLPAPPSVPAFGASPQRGRRLRNARLKHDLELELVYPSYVEGEAQIEAEEGGAPSQEPAPPPPAYERPSFIRSAHALPTDENVRYAGSDELLASYTALGAPLGLSRVGVNLCVLPPGRRTSWPHAHSTEEELVYVLEGTPDLWVDGTLHRLAPGDVAGFPPGTGIAHAVLNNTASDVRLLVVGEKRGDDQVFYPLHPARQASLPDQRRWSDAPTHAGGPHDGLPDRQRRG